MTDLSAILGDYFANTTHTRPTKQLQWPLLRKPEVKSNKKV